MANIGTWKSPFPLRFGGRSHQRIETLYGAFTRGRGSLQAGAAGTGQDLDIENMVAARAVSTGFRATERRVTQADPSKLSHDKRPVTDPETGEVVSISPLGRWEKILGIAPQQGAKLVDRRALVGAYVLGYGSNSHHDVVASMTKIFGSWLVSVSSPTIADVASNNAVSFWPPPAGGFDGSYPGTTSFLYPWSSTIARTIVRYRAPAAATTSDVTRKTADAARVLDAMLPAWGTFVLSPAPADGSGGFTLGSGLIGTTAL